MWVGVRESVKHTTQWLRFQLSKQKASISLEKLGYFTGEKMFT